MHPQKYAVSRARDMRKLTKNNAILVIREMVENHGIDPDVAVNFTVVAFQLGMNDQVDIRREAQAAYPAAKQSVSA